MLNRFLHLAASQNPLYQQALECLEYFCVIATLVSKSLQKILWTAIKVEALRTQRFSGSFHFTYIGTTCKCLCRHDYAIWSFSVPPLLHTRTTRRKVVRRGANQRRLYIYMGYALFEKFVESHKIEYFQVNFKEDGRKETNFKK